MKWAIQKDKQKLLFLKDEYCRIPLYYAASCGHMDILQYLIKEGSEVGIKDNDERTPLHGAALAGHADVIDYLTDVGIDVKARDTLCRTALHEAVCRNHLEAAVMLIIKGVDINAEEGRQGMTALHICAERGFHELAEQLIIYGADMYASGDSLYSKTPLHLACMNGHAKVAQVLVERGADISALSGFLDKNPLHLACEYGHKDTAEILVKNGADLQSFGIRVNGSTPLQLACLEGHVDVVEMLLNYNPQLSIFGKYTTVGTALHVAADYGEDECMKLLLAAGSEIDYREDRNGYTPLHMAVISENYHAAKFLIDSLCNWDIKDYHNHTALDLCKDPLAKEELRLATIPATEEKLRIKKEQEQKQREEEAEAERQRQLELERLRQEELLRQKNAREKEQFRRLLLAAVDRSGELSAISDLATEFPLQDINMYVIAEEKCTALMRAATKGFEAVVVALIQWPGIDLDMQDISGDTALHAASQRGFKNIVEHLLLAGAKFGVINNLGKVAANVAKTGFIREVCRNPSLIEHKALQGFTGQAYLATKRMTGIFDTKRPDLSWTSSPSVNRLMVEDHQLSPVVSKMRSMIHGFGEQAFDDYDDEYQKEPFQDEINQTYQTYENYHDPMIKGSRVNTGFSRREPSLTQQSIDTEEFSHGRFGQFPPSFGGCRDNMFPIDEGTVNDNNVENLGLINSLQVRAMTKDEFKEIKFLEYKQQTSILEEDRSPDKQSQIQERIEYLRRTTSSQAALPPTSFDKTDQWLEIKDFLWLIGYPYKPKSTGDEMQKDKRWCLYRIAKVMDVIQYLFVRFSQFNTDNDGNPVTEEIEESTNNFIIQCFYFVQCLLDLYEPAGGWPSKSNGDPLEYHECFLALEKLHVITPKIREAIIQIYDVTTPQRRHEMDNLPFRFRRQSVDCIYEVAVVMKERAEASFPADAIRAHFWKHSAVKSIYRQSIVSFHKSTRNNTEGQALVPKETMTNTNRSGSDRLTGFDLWLQDLCLDEYRDTFFSIGFKKISDFSELSFDDCSEYFPFIKVGDMRRLSKSIEEITPDLCSAYDSRAFAGDIHVTLLPLPFPQSNGLVDYFIKGSKNINQN